MDMTLSAYISAWDLVQNAFDYETALGRAVAFFDEVVVAVNTSKDDTLARLQALAARGQVGHEPTPGLYVGPSGEWVKLRVIATDLAYTDITFDGRVKDAALQACTGDVLVQMDLDEFVPLNQRALWRRYAEELLTIPQADCFMLPSVDLWGSMDTVRADARVGTKFRMHKRGLHRGVWKEAWMGSRTHFDTSKSDSCELLDAKGDLVRAMAVVPPNLLHPSTLMMLNGYPFTVHTGYVSFDQRVRVNKAIWAEHWQLRSGHTENVAVDKASLEGYPVVPHRLALS